MFPAPFQLPCVVVSVPRNVTALVVIGQPAKAIAGPAENTAVNRRHVTAWIVWSLRKRSSVLQRVRGRKTHRHRLTDSVWTTDTSPDGSWSEHEGSVRTFCSYVNGRLIV